MCSYATFSSRFLPTGTGITDTKDFSPAQPSVGPIWRQQDASDLLFSQEKLLLTSVFPKSSKEIIKELIRIQRFLKVSWCTHKMEILSGGGWDSKEYIVSCEILATPHCLLGPF